MEFYKKANVQCQSLNPNRVVDCWGSSLISHISVYWYNLHSITQLVIKHASIRMHRKYFLRIRGLILWQLTHRRPRVIEQYLLKMARLAYVKSQVIVSLWTTLTECERDSKCGQKCGLICIFCHACPKSYLLLSSNNSVMINKPLHVFLSIFSDTLQYSTRVRESLTPTQPWSS